LIGPLAIGSLVIAVGTKGAIITPALVAASALSIIQIVVSLWALISRWSENLAYYLESKADNYQISDRFKDLANNTSYSDSKWRREFEVLETLGVMRGSLDHRHDISDEEKRMGMRASLRNFQRECVGCKTTPTSMESSTCNVCGGYKKRKIKWLM
jgi:mobilome CxxCx(11)CxxC protein